MTSKEHKQLASKIAEKTKEVSGSTRKAKKFLVEAGICTPKGNLKKAYK